MRQGIDATGTGARDTTCMTAHGTTRQPSWGGKRQIRLGADKPTARRGAVACYLAETRVSQDDASKARLRLGKALEKIVEREQQLGQLGFLSLPERTQDQLAVLQGQAEPKDETPEAWLASEHILERYDSQLTTAFNLVAQVSGEQERQTAVRRKRGLFAVAALVLVVVGGFGGFSHYQSALAAQQVQCPKQSACASDGLCHAEIRWYPPPVAIQCLARADADCQASKGCRELGRCHARQGRCIATEDEDCRATERCKVDGWCRAREGQCVAASAEDCRATKGCSERGACTPVENLCVPGSDEDCRQSQLCRARGACKEVENRCVVLPEGFDQ